jgi:hypothetical protein
MSGPSFCSASPSKGSSSSRCEVVRLVPALRRFVAALREGWMTCDFVGGSTCANGCEVLGDGERRLVVVGRDLPFLKKDTLT